MRLAVAVVVLASAALTAQAGSRERAVERAQPLHATQRFRPSPGAPLPTIEVDWASIIATSKTTTTCQVVSNAILARSYPPSQRMFELLSELPVELTRYVPWFPMPWFGVPELQPGQWNTTYVAQMLNDTLQATIGQNRSAVINFSTQPVWLYVNGSGIPVPSDPLATDFGYPGGFSVPVDPTYAQMGEYFARVIHWIVRGWVIAEDGRNITGGPAAPMTHWEVLNEPEGCHGQDPVVYTQIFDAVVKATRALGVDLTWVGLALEGPEHYDWYQYFLNESNHDPSVWDAVVNGYISFHHYGSASSRVDPDAYEEFFPNAIGFAQGIAPNIVAVRNAMSPTTRMSADELGVILPSDNDPSAPDFPDIYWNAAAGMYALEVITLSPLGIDILGESQFAGAPPIPGLTEDPQFPSVSLMNWTTGEGTARYWVLRMLAEEIGPGDQYARTVVASDPLCGVMQSSPGVRLLRVGSIDRLIGLVME